jgi:hypothetical protein
MPKTWRIDTLSCWNYTLPNYAYKFRCFINTEYIRSPCLYLESGALTSQVYASSAVLHMNKGIQKLWRYAALQWHNVTTKHPEYR